MQKKHAELKSAAKKAVDDLFADTSVSRHKTRESLEELQAEITMLLETIEP